MDEDRKIRTKSINAITYILYQNPVQDLDYYIDPTNGQILFQVDYIPNNIDSYLEYKKAVRNNGVLKVDLILYNNILRDIKFQTKEFRNNLN